MNIDAQLISNLRKNYGDAFYLLDTNQFKINFNELNDSFQKIYQKFNIAYSYKTNYTPKLCKVVDKLGGYAEVVSEMELEIALRIGVNPDRIIWNGPVKNNKVVESFIIKGGIVNIDSIEELKIISHIVSRNKDINFNIGIRCNFDVGDGVVSRFGFDTENKDFIEAIKFIKANSNVKFANLQCHFAKRQIDYWPSRAKGMLDIINNLNILPERIDLGGGMYGKMEDSLKAQFKTEIPSYTNYAQSVATIFSDFFEDKLIKPELLIEPGSALVGDCMKFVCTVKTIKNIRGQWFATVLGSQKNINMNSVNPPIQVISMGGEQKTYNKLNIVGYTCIEDDVLYHNFNGKLANDDVIVISNCGSYSLVMKPPFILPNFPVLEINDNYIEVIKRGENFDDLFQTFNF